MSDFKLSASTTVMSLSSHECVELVKSGVCERFLRRYAVDYVPSPGGYWAPVELVERDLLELMKVSDVMVTNDRDGDHEIRSLSFAGSLLLKTKSRAGHVKVEVQYFGSMLDDLTEHVRALFSRSVAFLRGRDISVVINFPTCIDREAATEAISKDVTGGLKYIETPPNAHLSSIKLYSKRPLQASKL